MLTGDRHRQWRIMRRLGPIAVAFVLVLSAASTLRPAAAAAATSTFVVDLRSDADTARAGDIARAYGGRATYVYEAVLGGFAFEGTEQAAGRLARDSRVELVEPNSTYTAAGDPRDNVRHLERTDAYEAYDAAYTGAGVTIALLDTGVDKSHNVFEAHDNIKGGKSCVGGGTADLEGHGTASASNAVGKIGIAHEATVTPVKVFPGASLNTTLAALICGLNWVRRHNVGLLETEDIDIVNMSVAGPGSSGLKKAVNKVLDSGVVITAAAGNNGGATQSPANYAGVIAVSALGGGDRMASFSARGGDMTAPGVGIFSAENGGGYSRRSGTSRSSPMVAGAAAIVLGENAAADVRSVLRKSGKCPNGDINGASGGFCPGRWRGDDSNAEPLVNAYCAGDWADGVVTDVACTGAP
jgi:subtilisin family serine protease